MSFRSCRLLAVKGFGPRCSGKPPMGLSRASPFGLEVMSGHREASEADAVVRRKTGGLGLRVEVERSGQIEGVP